MLKLLYKLDALFYSSSSKKTFDIKVEDEDMDIQAFLLTDYALGVDALLLQKDCYAHNEYDLRPFAIRTFRALVDRILHFAIRAVNTAIEHKSQMFLLDESGNIRYEYDLRNRLSVNEVLDTLKVDIQEGEKLLEEYRELSVLTDLNLDLAHMLISDVTLENRVESLRKEYERVEGLLDLSETVRDWNARMKKFMR